ncbi:class I SAM-dependent methyltransferase [Bartonella henselae]|uniref:class I SAM-dependent methyltransferase n=1 Tax=Bartonella henselae TaxID=38323 RepID=UPI0009639231|nr:class I SAM-dependent methyltransferase [Bartonella henselae]OLL53192.1 SAM-dependent methyltransferase [Bartonella henselae]OLL55875.1 SAM-dependent methyltransferase [Bartonella henselae]UJM32387.1 class I SAM-dependent methyltransferase [Bartonella henselae]
MDIVTLKDFYASVLGKRVQETLCGQLNLCWPDLTGKRVMGFGYALPYLSALRMRAQQCLAFMPAGQGALPWPCADKVATALVFEEDLPLPDASIDCVLLIHALEYTENSFETLNEIWRVLVPNGQLIVIVPNRSGLWARNACTPFGYGEPYSRQQIVRLFEKTHFVSGSIQEVVHYMPSSGSVSRFFSFFYEPVARHLLPYFGGLLICQAQKRVYQGLLVQRRQSRRVFMPALLPQARESSLSS